MITTTIGKAFNAYLALCRIRGKVRGKTALDLFHLKNVLQEKVDFCNDAELQLVEDHGGKILDNGTIIIADPEKKKAYLKARQDLNDMECEINEDPVTVDLEKNPDITMEDIELLDGFVIFE